LLTAYIKEKLTGTGLVISYAPWRGAAAKIDLEHPEKDLVQTHLPDFWWTYPGTTTMEKVVVLVLGLCAVGAGGLLVRRVAAGPRGLTAVTEA
jgi:hypothetical protein